MSKISYYLFLVFVGFFVGFVLGRIIIWADDKNGIGIAKIIRKKIEEQSDNIFWLGIVLIVVFVFYIVLGIV